MARDPKPTKQPVSEPKSGRRPRGPIRVSMPASVMNDLDAFQRGMASVAAHLGHPQCFSGVDISFIAEREFILNEGLEVRLAGAISSPAGLVSSTQDPVPVGPTVTVTLPAEVGYNLEQVKAVVARIAQRIGCAPCHSGFDLRFRQELDFLVDPQGMVHTSGERA